MIDYEFKIADSRYDCVGYNVADREYEFESMNLISNDLE